MHSAACPSREALSAFAVGNLGDAAWTSLAEHLEACEHCRALLEEFDGTSDVLVHKLHQVPSASGEREVEPWISVLASQGASMLSGRRVVADAGRDLARRLREGPVRLDRFELQAELGVGSFGHVFKAWDPLHQRVVALKVQRAGTLATQEETQRFLREARSAASLKHSAIVSLYETGETEDGACYLVCEYIDGVTLERQLGDGPLSAEEAARLTAELADALQYAHEHGVIHRDIKPSNIILDARRHVHLMDFGLAKREAGELTMTSDGRVMGTPAYMSPEQARGGSHGVDPRSDIYSLGVVFYEMLTGQRPFQGDRRQLLIQVLEEDARPPRTVRPGVPRDLDVICLKAISKAPAKRYQTAKDLAGDLRRYLQGQPILARPMGNVERTLRWCRRNPVAVGVLAAVLLGSIAGLAYLSSLSEYFVRETALEGARLETKMLDEVWRFYSEEIQDIDPQKSNILITEKYRTVHPSLPLPATFAIDLGERISTRSPGMEVRVFSRYPWPGRAAGGPQDEFDSAALEWLESNARPEAKPAAEYSRFVSEGHQRRLVYYTARHMEQSCLGCHNHPQGLSPKKDWKVGEVVGVMKIVRPLDREIESTRKGLRGAVALMATVATLLSIVSVGVSVLATTAKGGRRMTRDEKANGCSGGANSTSLSLISEARHDDPAAWARMVHLYAPLVAFWCRRWGVAGQDVVDVVQEVFAAVASHLDRFHKDRPGDTFRGWLATIARNKVRDYYRRRADEPAAVGGTEASLRLAQIHDPDADLELEDAADDAGFSEVLSRALEGIRSEFHEQTWRAFWGVAVEGRSTSDVAEALGMQPGTVRVAKSRVLARLRGELGDLRP